MARSFELSELSKYMEVIKRDGRREGVSFDKITERIRSMCAQLNLKRINPVSIAQHTVSGLYDGITTEELDFYAANLCAERIQDDPEYNILAAGICVSNLHKTTSDDFLEVTTKLFQNKDKFGDANPLITEEYVKVVKDNIDAIKKQICYDRDFYFDFFAIKTLERAYLIRMKDNEYNRETTNDEAVLREKYGRIIERPQHMIMRVSLAIHMDNLEKAFETYNLISNQYFTHASPTLYNAATPQPQLSSCFLLGMEDSITGIFKTVSDVSEISKLAGGIGIHINDIRAAGSLIRGTNGTSDGVIPLAKVLNSVARYVNQGGRRNGAIALYLEPWHADIFEFCELRQNTGAEELRARDIFLSLWIPDIFMKRVRDGGMWSLMCPDECPGLTDTYGSEFEELYLRYEKEKRYKRQVSADKLWIHILACQTETGMPYMLYKDSCNEKSNQKNLGTIRSSNLCSEIVEYSDTNEYAVCNLASLCLPRFLEEKDGELIYNFQKLYEVTRVVTRNLNRVIDINYYPVEEARNSNMRHRPIGLGVQGLANVYCRMNYPFDSDEAYDLNKRIFETIYFGALTESNQMAKEEGPYSTFKGSPFSEGKLQYHMWGLTEDDLLMSWDWEGLIESIKTHGTRNSLLTAIMPTASTSQLMCNTECIEPHTSNLYTRTTLAGEYVVINKYLVETLIELGLWTKEIREEFLYDNGSIQNIEEIPQHIKDVYKTAYEMKTKPVVQQAIDRGPFVDQSQSMNIFSNEPNFRMLASSHFYGWKNGLKTGMYYLRSQVSVDPIKFGLDPVSIKRIKIKRGEMQEESSDDEDTTVRQDPRRLSEIEVAHGTREARANNYVECTMCSG